MGKHEFKLESKRLDIKKYIHQERVIHELSKFAIVVGFVGAILLIITFLIVRGGDL